MEMAEERIMAEVDMAEVEEMDQATKEVIDREIKGVMVDTVEIEEVMVDTAEKVDMDQEIGEEIVIMAKT